MAFGPARAALPGCGTAVNQVAGAARAGTTRVTPSWGVAVGRSTPSSTTSPAAMNPAKAAGDRLRRRRIGCLVDESGAVVAPQSRTRGSLRKSKPRARIGVFWQMKRQERAPAPGHQPKDAGCTKVDGQTAATARSAA